MSRVLCGILLVSAAWAQSKPGGLMYFLNGAGVEMHTESSGGRSPLSTAGSIAGGTPAQRVVLDAQDNPIFGYDLELKKLADGRVSMRIGPADQQKVRANFPKVTGPIATVSAWRDFPPLNVGDEVQVDILYRPATGEKLWDVLKIIEDRQSFPRAATSERFSFERFTVTIDGKVVAERPNTWMIGGALKMHLAAYGDYYIVLTPTSDFPFQTAWIDHNKLRFKAGGQQVEIVGKSNILQHSEFGTVWVHFVDDGLEKLNRELAEALKVYTKNHPDVRKLQARIAAAAQAGEGSDFTCADNMDQLTGKKE